MKLATCRVCKKPTKYGTSCIECIIWEDDSKLIDATYCGSECLGRHMRTKHGVEHSKKLGKGSR